MIEENKRGKKSMQVSQFYNKNQFLIEGNGFNLLQSYDSQVAKIEKGLLILGNDWDYSRTTLKHVYLFINDFLNWLNDEQYNLLYDLNEKTNKHEYLKKLIKLNKIDVLNDL